MATYFRIFPGLFAYCLFSTFCGVVKTEDLIGNLRTEDLAVVRLSSYITLVIGGCLVFLTFSAMTYLCILLLEYKNGHELSDRLVKSIEKVILLLMIKEVIVIYLYLQLVSDNIGVFSVEDIEMAFTNELFLNATLVLNVISVCACLGVFLFDYFQSEDQTSHTAVAWSYSCFIIGLLIIQFGSWISNKFSGYE